MSMAQTTRSGEPDLLAAIGPRSLFFGACAALFAPPLQAPPPRPTISVTAAVPPAGSAQVSGARLAFGAPLLDVALPRKPLFVDAAVPPAGVGLVSHQAPASFPPLTAPPRRNIQVTPNWIPPLIPSIVFGATETTKDQRPAKTIVARQEFRPQEFPSVHMAMPVQMVPPLTPPRPRALNVPQQLPQFLPSTVFWRSEALPTSFATAPLPAGNSLGFTISAAPAISVQGLPGDWLQVQDEGINLGNANVTVIDFRGDPAVIKATRGVGENSHVITVRIVGPECTHFLTDNFNGTGALAVHTPDVAPSGFIWQPSGNTVSLDGTGHAVPNTVNSSSYVARNDVDSWPTMVTGTDFSILLTGKLPVMGWNSSGFVGFAGLTNNSYTFSDFNTLSRKKSAKGWLTGTATLRYAEVLWDDVSTPTNGLYEIGISDGTSGAGVRVTWNQDGHVWFDGASDVGSSTAFSDGDTVNLAYDAATDKVWLGRNGVWFAGGNPATGANPTRTFPASPGTKYYVRVKLNSDVAIACSATIRVKTAQFVYAVPAGASSWSGA